MSESTVEKSSQTLLVVMEDGGDATAIDHSNFNTSNIKVSAGPVKGKTWSIDREESWQDYKILDTY